MSPIQVILWTIAFVVVVLGLTLSILSLSALVHTLRTKWSDK